MNLWEQALDPGYLPQDADTKPFADWSSALPGKTWNAASEAGRTFYPEVVKPVVSQMIWPQENSPYQRGIDAGLSFGMGPVRTTFSPSGFGKRTLAEIEYYPKGKPQETWGNLQYTPAEGQQAPKFWSILSHSARGTMEMLGELQRQLGPRLNDMKLSPILPEAAPFWRKLASSNYMEAWPQLRQRIWKNLETTKSDPDIVNTLKLQRQSGIRGVPMEELW